MGPKWPSAVEALAHAGRPFGMLGAGRTGQCNPEGANYKVGTAVRMPGHTGYDHKQWHTSLYSYDHIAGNVPLCLSARLLSAAIECVAAAPASATRGAWTVA